MGINILGFHPVGNCIGIKSTDLARIFNVSHGTIVRKIKKYLPNLPLINDYYILDWNQAMDIAMSFNNSKRNIEAKNAMVKAYIEARNTAGLLI